MSLKQEEDVFAVLGNGVHKVDFWLPICMATSQDSMPEEEEPESPELEAPKGQKWRFINICDSLTI